MPLKFNSQIINCVASKSQSSLVSYYWFCWCVYHGGVVDRRKVTINQVKFIFTQKNGPNCFDLDEGKVFTNTAMTSWVQKKAMLPVMLSTIITYLPAPNGTYENFSLSVETFTKNLNLYTVIITFT